MKVRQLRLSRVGGQSVLQVFLPGATEGASLSLFEVSQTTICTAGKATRFDVLVGTERLYFEAESPAMCKDWTAAIRREQRIALGQPPDEPESEAAAAAAAAAAAGAEGEMSHLLLSTVTGDAGAGADAGEGTSTQQHSGDAAAASGAGAGEEEPLSSPLRRLKSENDWLVLSDMADMSSTEVRVCMFVCCTRVPLYAFSCMIVYFCNCCCH